MLTWKKREQSSDDRKKELAAFDKLFANLHAKAGLPPPAKPNAFAEAATELVDFETTIRGADTAALESNARGNARPSGSLDPLKRLLS
jgi:hypothetical protein